ncbi:MAG: hypothetical protein COV43_04470 [Deltaproteobacteria bacterium CG11_big_fil_rev_8_21_14_0_20_42_23]|nr:MAG: hypothetical protein COV43_04470 [Deltaproteobacteria bacterium CG11_big_fil_rev_8_21_14_0_20_42_23]PJC65029.1 MAG: phage tail assembly protein [Deltaproteobacteria bacterium CG_4_9_14_0_2_um_filter_42_21]
MSSKEATIELDYPIEFGSEVYKKLTIRRPKAKDMRRFNPDNMNTGDFIDLMKDLVEVPDKVVDELDLVDLQKMSEVIGNFLARGQKTGNSG